MARVEKPGTWVLGFGRWENRLTLGCFINLFRCHLIVCAGEGTRASKTGSSDE
jgi:hypothetical protein